MKKINIIILLCITFIFLMPIKNGFALSFNPKSTYFNNPSNYRIETNMNVDDLKYALDNNPSTYATLPYSGNASIYFTLLETVDIKSIYLNSASSVRVRFFDANNKMLYDTYGSAFTESNNYEKDVDIKNVSRVYINHTSSNLRLYEFDIGVSATEDIQPPLDITNLTLNPTSNSILATWTGSESTDISHYELYIDDVLKESSFKETKYTFTGLSPGETHSIKVVSVDLSGNRSQGISTTTTTKNAPLEITDLISESESTNIKFSWKNPNDENFSTVNIYKDGKLLTSTPSTSYTVEGLEYAKTYTFVFKTVNKDGIESEGIKTTITTEAEPPTEVKNPDYHEQPNGDYVVTWEEPTTGKMRIIVGGKTYAEVPASQKIFTVPSADLKYNFLGEPDVRLQPISDTGKEGVPTVPPSEIESPFTPVDLIKTGNGLLFLIAPFLLLALSFLLVPKLRKLIFSSLKGSKGKEEPTRRTGRERELHEGRRHIRGIEDTKRAQKESREREERQSKVNEPIILAAAATPIKENDRKIREPRERPRMRVRRERQPRVSRERVRAPREPRTSRREL